MAKAVKSVGRKVATKTTGGSKNTRTSISEKSYRKYFSPNVGTPESFKIFTLIDWEVPLSTGSHT